jgi:hypothetical protein
MPDTGYGSPMFLRACRIVAAYGQIDARQPRALRAVWLRIWAGSPLLMWYRLRLPSIRIRLTASPAGRMIGEHFAIRERGHWKYRRAQGVLLLPAEFSQYLRGRHRQAVRTNVTHARSAGLTVKSCTVDHWMPGRGDFRAAHIAPGPIEKWMVLGPNGGVVADSILSVDEDVALLHGLVSSSPNARWLLHTAIVERLCGNCSVLLVNSEDAYLMGTGNQHFQRLLGYRIARLRFPRPDRALLKRSDGVPSLTEVDLQRGPGRLAGLSGVGAPLPAIHPGAED